MANPLLFVTYLVSKRQIFSASVSAMQPNKLLRSLNWVKKYLKSSLVRVKHFSLFRRIMFENDIVYVHYSTKDYLVLGAVSRQTKFVSYDMTQVSLWSFTQSKMKTQQFLYLWQKRSVTNGMEFFLFFGPANFGLPHWIRDPPIAMKNQLNFWARRTTCRNEDDLPSNFLNLSSNQIAEWGYYLWRSAPYDYMARYFAKSSRSSHASETHQEVKDCQVLRKSRTLLPGVHDIEV